MNHRPAAGPSGRQETMADGAPRAPSADPLISLRSVEKTFQTPRGPMRVVSDVSLDIERGEFITLIGPSGCGKTTILNMIAGFLPPDAGTLIIDGRAISGPGKERGVIFQEYGVFPWLTVEENIEFGLKLRANRGEASPTRRSGIVAHYIALMQLTGFERAYPKTLSGGMRQRLAIARTYATNPEVLLMDEPFGALDAQTRSVMQLALMKALQEERKTVVLITHSVEEAIFLSNRVVVVSARPARLMKSVDIPFAYPRAPEIVSSAEFQGLRVQLNSILMEQFNAQQQLTAIE